MKALLALFVTLAFTTGAAAQAQIVTEEMMVKSPDAGIEIYVRNKRPAAMTSFRPERTVLFVHGATYPAHAAFDLKLGGQSWMDYIASRGYDVYLLDLPGYGKSTRPKEMAEAPQNNDKVNKLVLYAPGWLRNAASLTDKGGTLGAYRSVSKADAKARWLTGVPEDKNATLIPAGWFEAWADATFATDPVGARQSPPVLRAPNGVIQDGREYWSAGKPLYDPGQIRVPTFLAHAEWDADLPSYMLYAYFE